MILAKPIVTGKIPFIQAHSTCYRRVNFRKIQLIVIHCMEAPEKGETAERVARYFASGSDGRQASAHYCIDNNSIVQCVQTRDVAFAAPGANHNGIQIELAGYASQSGANWLDEYGVDMLELAAGLIGLVLGPKFGVPAKFLDANDLKNLGPTQKGITTHAEVTKAFRRSTHTDPGPNFPLQYFLDRVQSYGR